MDAKQKPPRSVPALRSLDERELSNVAGGKGVKTSSLRLYEAACKGTHLPEVTIELW